MYVTVVNTPAFVITSRQCVCVCVCVYVCVFVCTSAYASRYVPPMRTAMTISVPLLKPINYSRSNPRISKTSAGKLSQSLVFCPPVVGVIPLHPPICWPAALGGQTCVCVRVCACVCVCVRLCITRTSQRWEIDCIIWITFPWGPENVLVHRFNLT